MTPPDFERDVEDHAEKFDAAEVALVAVLMAYAAGEIDIAQAEAGIDRIARDLELRSTVWSGQVMPDVYVSAVNDAERRLRAPRTPSAATMGQDHRGALNLGTAAILDDLAAASQNMARDARQTIREIAGLNLASGMISGPRVAAQAVAEAMDERGVRMVDNIGRRWRTRGYAAMAMRTKVIETRNRAHVMRSGELGSPGVQVIDGMSGDTDEPCTRANGQFWSNDYAMTHLLEHPNCRRTFSPLPRDWDGTLDRT